MELQRADLKGLSEFAQRILLAIAEERGRYITATEIAEKVYADRIDGGPVTASETVRQILRRSRHRVPPGWILLSGRQGYALVWAEAAVGADLSVRVEMLECRVNHLDATLAAMRRLLGQM